MSTVGSLHVHCVRCSQRMRYDLLVIYNISYHHWDNQWQMEHYVSALNSKGVGPLQILC